MATETVTLEEGKYALVHNTHGHMHALRYGDPWQELTGNKLIGACFNEIVELRKRLTAIHDMMGDTPFTAEFLVECITPLAKPTWPEDDHRG